jgi:predicted N-acetyltransferase YhbS
VLQPDGVQLVAASDDDRRQRDGVSFIAWGAPLSLEQYLVREERLRAHPWSRAAMDSWLWRDADGAVLASCETYRMKSRINDVGGETWAGASVFVEPTLRGRGHARAMMQALVARARASGAQASILFSDVGARIYEASGYVARPADDIVFPPATGDAAATVDALLLEAITVPAPDDDFVVWPMVEQLDWHLERTRAYALLLGRPSLPAVGARAGGGVAIWAIDWKQERLLVLALGGARAHEAEALIEAARRLAKTLGLADVRLWAQPWGFAGRADLGGDRVARVGSLPMIAPFAPALSASAWQTIPRGVWV